MDAELQHEELRQLIDKRRLLDRRIAELEQAEREASLAEEEARAAMQKAQAARQAALAAQEAVPAVEEPAPAPELEDGVADPKILAAAAARYQEEYGEAPLDAEEAEAIHAPVAKGPPPMQAPPAGDSEVANALIALTQQMTMQNQQMMERLAATEARLAAAEAGAQNHARPPHLALGSLAGGYVHGDGLIAFDEPQLSSERKWTEMESHGGLLG